MKRLLRILAVIGPYLVAPIAVFAISPPFNTPWNAAYEALPTDTEQESLGAGRIRDLKQEIRLRMQQDHSWNGDGNDGYHNKVTLIEQSTDPTSVMDAGAVAGILYTKQVNGNSELFFKDSNGSVNQITTGGQIASSVPSGAVFYTATLSPPAGYLEGDGSAVSRTSYPNLFSAVGTTYGSGDGSTTFNLPDCRAREIAGLDTNNSTGRMTGAYAGGLSAATLGDTGGEQAHLLTAAEIPSITSNGTTSAQGLNSTGPELTTGVGGGSGGDAFATSNGGSGTYTVSGTIPALALNVTSNNTGGQANNNLPPSIVMNCIIKY